MPVHDFFRNFNETDERFTSIDDLPDHRSDIDKEHTPLAVYNHGKPDLALAERWAEEAVNIGGAFVTLYQKEPYLDKDDLDDVWDEDADPLYAPGIDLKASYKTDNLNIEFTQWGVDSTLQTTITFARAVLAKAVGMNRLLTVGDVIEIPYNAPKLRVPARFRVLNAYDSGNYHYRWLYYTAVCELLTGDEALRVTHRINSKIK
jgi:hypothetical protein